MRPLPPKAVFVEIPRPLAAQVQVNQARLAGIAKIRFVPDCVSFITKTACRQGAGLSPESYRGKLEKPLWQPAMRLEKASASGGLEAMTTVWEGPIGIDGALPEGAKLNTQALYGADVLKTCSTRREAKACA